MPKFFFFRRSDPFFRLYFAENGFDMRKICQAIASILLCLVSCTPVDLTSRMSYVIKDSSLEGPEPAEPDIVPVFFIAGLEFGDGYDWRRDPDYGFSDCTMFLESGGVRLAGFDVGYESEVSSDADMVRCIGGHVYTDFSTDTETVIKRDGAELFRYPGREMILSLLPTDEGICTLGVPREGSGWTYRCNGVLVGSASAGIPERMLYEDSGKVCFSYSVTDYGFYGSESTYHIVEDGISRQILPPTGYELSDCLRCGGKLYLLLRKESTGMSFLSCDGLLAAVTVNNTSATANAVSLVSDGESVYVCGAITNRGDGSVTDAVWKGTVLHTVFEEDFCLDFLYPSGDGIFAVGHDCLSPSAVVTYHGGTYSEMDAGYVFSSRGCGAFSHGHYCIAMNPESPGAAPYFIIDGKRMDLEINGWIAGVGYELSESSQDTVLDESGLTEM